MSPHPISPGTFTFLDRSPQAQRALWRQHGVGQGPGSLWAAVRGTELAQTKSIISGLVSRTSCPEGKWSFFQLSPYPLSLKKGSFLCPHSFPTEGPAPGRGAADVGLSLPPPAPRRSGPQLSDSTSLSPSLSTSQYLGSFFLFWFPRSTESKSFLFPESPRSFFLLYFTSQLGSTLCFMTITER